MKIALAQINPTVGDFQGNTKKIIEFAAEASAAQADLVMFPELAVCGYPPADFLDKPSFVARTGEAVAEICYRDRGPQTGHSLRLRYPGAPGFRQTGGKAACCCAMG